MSKDQMQDVFPIVFDFKKGEAPTAEKLTGLVKQLDVGLSKATQGIGDPWDQQQNQLSLEKLGQTNLARIIGPSDYLSPPAGSWNESVDMTVVLSAGRNQWNFGFPLVKTTATIEEFSSLSAVTPLAWPGDFAILGGSDTSILVNKKTTLEELTTDGDFHIDFYTGTITSYKPLLTPNYIWFAISDITSSGPGAPWSTPNVIPTWEETSVLCSLTGGPVAYTLTLPVIGNVPRINTSDTISGGIKSVTDKDVYSDYVNTFGRGTKYRLPQSLLSLAAIDLPDGYVLLWDDSLERIVPGCTFQKGSDAYSLTVLCSGGWLTVGTGRYRLLVPGSSVAESINYLATTSRDNRHIGLTDGALTKKTLFYSSPISHDTLINLYSGTVAEPLYAARYQFRQSNYSTNCHPQYLHRYGFMANDKDGNHANAMMGDIVFTNDESNNWLVDNGTGTTPSIKNSFGLRFGGLRSGVDDYARINYSGGPVDTTWTSGVAKKIGFGLFATGCSSLAAEDTGTLAYTPRYDGPFYLRGRNTSDLFFPDFAGGALGFDLGRSNELNYVKLFSVIREELEKANQPAKIDQTNFNTPLSITPDLTGRLAAEQLREFRFRGGPYLSTATNLAGSLGSTTSIGELEAGTTSLNVYGFVPIMGNFILLDTSEGDCTNRFITGRTITTTGAANSSNNRTETIITATYQNISGAYRTVVQVSITTSFVLETSSSAVAKMQKGEFDQYFTSPGVVGADFLNLYSNAIFFSDTGDGKRTSLTDHGKDYFDTNAADKMPSGLYFMPEAPITGEPALMLSVMEGGTAAQPFSVGNVHGLWYSGGNILLQSTGGSTNAVLHSINGDAGVVSGGSGVTYHSSTLHGENTFLLSAANITLGNDADTYMDNVFISANKDYTRTTSSSGVLYLLSLEGTNIESDESIFVISGSDIYLNADNALYLNERTVLPLSTTVSHAGTAGNILEVTNALTLLTHATNVTVSSLSTNIKATSNFISLLSDTGVRFAEEDGTQYGSITMTSSKMLISGNSGLQLTHDNGTIDIATNITTITNEDIRLDIDGNGNETGYLYITNSGLTETVMPRTGFRYLVIDTSNGRIYKEQI
jgi:hypothetical protein